MDRTTVGTLYFDAFESRRSTYIGPVSGQLAVPSITYDYDPLYRLTPADYDDGTFFHYTYDPVGNRLTEVTQSGSTNYIYDIANRLTSVNGQTYTWDPRGNLLNDGVSTYTYDRANRLTAVSGQPSAYSFSYNGLGDRLRQTVDAVQTNYSLDLEGGFTQVLSDGQNAYLYGQDLTTGQGFRIGEEQTGGWEYHLPDALMSSRQLVDEAVDVDLAQSYQPFGTTLVSAGTAASVFQFTGEQGDGTGLVYLRARYLNVGVGRFMTRDTWEGDVDGPMSYNLWQYAYANPLNFTDPSGLLPCRGYACLHPEENYNLTGWLVRAMDSNAGSPKVTEIRFLNESARSVLRHPWLAVIEALIDSGLDPGSALGCVYQGLFAKARAYSFWRSLVRTGARWDFKVQIDRELGENILLCSSTRDCRWYDSDVTGNVHYGFVGRAAGFTPLELYAGAGLAQQQRDDPSSGRIWALGDDPLDAVAIRLGIQLHDNFIALSVDLFRSVLLRYRTNIRLGREPSPLEYRALFPVDPGLGPRFPVTHFDAPR